MKYLLAKEDDAADLLAIPCWEGPVLVHEVKYPAVAAVLKTGDFKGKNGETLTLYLEGGKAKRLLLVGLGKKETSTPETMRRAASAVTRAAHGMKAKTVNVFAFHGQETAVKALGEGLFLANYAFDRLKGEPKKETSLVETFGFIHVDRKHSALLDRLLVIAEGVAMARDLVNGNADEVNPLHLAETARMLAKVASSLHVTVHDKAWLEKQKMGLILAVNRAASVDPYLIEVSYRGNPSSQEHIVLVGKGVTYDTGGLALKTVDGMLAMKCDMAGAAAVLATIRTIALLQLKVNVTVVVPTVENSIGPLSYKMGDVYTSYSGKTVEVNNTDAEGRLILADAMAYAARHLKPTMMIDLATLTGNVVMSLGEHMAGFCANDEELAKRLREAAKENLDHLWQLPLCADYKEAFKSDIADMTNSGGRDAGCIKGALFLEEFISKVPWAHIDIAGAAYWSKPKYYHPTKATGYGVALLTEFLSRC